jgi:hypothetical protein
VIAHYADHSSRDVTQLALYESNDRALAEVDDSGSVKFLDLPGNVAVMVRYQGKVAVSNASVRLGAAVENLPPCQEFCGRTRIR